MSTGSTRKFNVEWITVSYRSVGLVLLILIVAVAGSFYWYYSHAMVPKNEAERAISRASHRLTQALELPLDGSAREMVENAELQLIAARAELVKQAYREASIAAIRSEKLSMRAASMASGKKADVLVQFAKIEGNVRVKQAAFSVRTMPRLRR